MGAETSVGPSRPGRQSSAPARTARRRSSSAAGSGRASGRPPVGENLRDHVGVGFEWVVGDQERLRARPLPSSAEHPLFMAQALLWDDGVDLFVSRRTIRRGRRLRVHGRGLRDEAALERSRSAVLGRSRRAAAGRARLPRGRARRGDRRPRAGSCAISRRPSRSRARRHEPGPGEAPTSRRTSGLTSAASSTRSGRARSGRSWTPRGRVHGVQGLVVADASIMPTIPAPTRTSPPAAVAERSRSCCELHDPTVLPAGLAGPGGRRRGGPPAPGSTPEADASSRRRASSTSPSSPAARALRLSAHRPAWHRAARPAGTRRPARAAARRSPAATATTATSCAEFGARVVGLSAQPIDDQRRGRGAPRPPPPGRRRPGAATRGRVGLPTFEFGGCGSTSGSLVAEQGRIGKVFYPVFPPDENAADVVAWLRERGS